MLLIWITFFLMTALTTNAGFLVSGDVWELVIAAVFNLCALVVKWKLKTDFMGRVSLAVSIAAVLHIVPAAILGLSLGIFEGMDVSNMTAGSTESAIYGLTFGALVANIVSAVLLIAEAATRSVE
ncbi:MAG: hypothetical protein A7316_05840 [Candidatus Altiarchaeales archaeon WOR_SM1_86-2]|nr:MAG: hypothetical protein A7315_05640 [Candidatus Altiarchaeales archaeon WOR_SM1_79]ODS39360.1 MAG: hypothetical protein A7316_05840 [Candidatus Altiarchaeales archaeon WOR_SM1_86-2]